MSKQEVAHELRRMQSRMLNLESWRTSYLWRHCMGCQQQKCWSYYLPNPLKSSSSTCSIPPSWLNPSPVANLQGVKRKWEKERLTIVQLIGANVVLGVLPAKRSHRSLNNPFNE
jgi:hypothetical protein